MNTLKGKHLTNMVKPCVAPVDQLERPWIHFGFKMDFFVWVELALLLLGATVKQLVYVK